MDDNLGTNPSVTVQIINWNGMAYLDQCLNAVYAQDYRGAIEVLLIDNASTDGSLDIVLRKFPQVRIIRNQGNLGFSRGHNLGIRSSRSDLVMVLNFDVVLQPDFLRRTVEAIRQNPKIGMISGKLYKLVDGKRSNMLDTTGIRMRQYFSMPRGETENDQLQYDGMECRKIFGPCGAAPLYRREMLEDIRFKDEYFDEIFINYVEDVDLAWRAQLRGWDSVYVPEAVAYHERGATRKTNVPEQRAYLVRGYRNRYLAMYKNMTRAELVRRIFPLLLDEIAIILLAGRYAGSFGIRCEAAWEAAKTVGRFRLKRKFVQSHLHSSYIRAIPLLEFKPFSYIEICIRRALGFIKKCGRIFLCQFELGRAILRRYYLMRGKPFPS